LADAAADQQSADQDGPDQHGPDQHGQSQRGPRQLLARLRSPQDAEILRLAVPAFGALVAEPLFLLADSAIVGRLGTVPLGGLGIASQVLATLVGVSIFLAYGTTATVARQLGAGNRQAAIRHGIDGLWLAAGIGLVVLAAGWPLAPELVGAFGGSAAVSHQAVTYLQISLLGAPAMLAVLAGTGVLRGLQDMRTPLVVAIAANGVNIALNATFVLGLHWGIAGSAWGTFIAQSATAAAYLRVVARGARREGVSLRPDRAGITTAAFAGASLVLRTLALQAVLVLMTAIAARESDAAIAASQVAMRIWNLFVYALDAIAIAAQAITGRFLGAGDVAGARGANRRMIAWGAAYGVLFSLVLLALRPVLPGLFGVTPDVRSLLLAVLLVIIVQQPVAGVVFVLDGVLIGAGDQDYLALAGLATLAVFCAAAAIAARADAGLVGLWVAYAVWMLARFATLTLRSRSSRWLVTGATR
jgi:putative MATE family efflux protein